MPHASHQRKMGEGRLQTRNGVGAPLVPDVPAIFSHVHKFTVFNKYEQHKK